MSRFEDRPIMSWSGLCALGPVGRHSRRALLNCGEFLKAVKAVSGHLIRRGTVQFYSSPAVRLMPLPRYARRHTAHYPHPEATMRLAIIVHLRSRYFFPIKLLREVLATLPPDHYGLVLRDAFTADEIRLLARPEGRDIAPRGLIFQRVSRLLSVAQSWDEAGADPLGDGGLSGALALFESWLEAQSGLESSRKPAAAVCSIS